MPRYVINDSEDESEPKTGRRTRAALAASTTTDSPIRRSTRIRHGSVNPDGSSPESINGAAVTQVTRVTRRRVAAAAAGDTLTVPEPGRNLRSRKNSVSSNVSENHDVDSAPSTPKTRAIKRLSIVEPSPSTPKLGTRRSMRASSETKSPAPVARTTRRTRATSIDPEPSIDRVTKGAAAGTAATPTRKRRQPASVHPTEPALPEETNEDTISSDIDEVVEIPDDESDEASSPEKPLSKSSRRASSSSAKKSPKNESMKDQTETESENDKSQVGKLSETSSASEISPAKDKSVSEKAEGSEPLKPTVQIQSGNVSATDIEAKNSPRSVQSLVMKTKRNSLDKSKELGMQIEDLLNKSTEEQEKSPGNKENEKLNIVSPEKVKKNLEFTVSNVNILTRKSIGSTRFVNKSNEKKMNASLDERVLSKSRYDITPSKSIGTEDNEVVNSAQKSQNSTSEKKSQVESSNEIKSAKKNENEELQRIENRGEHSSSNSGYTKIDETIVENEVIEEFTLYDSNDSFEGSKNEFSLMVEDDVASEKKNNLPTIVSEDETIADGTSSQRQSSTESEKSVLIKIFDAGVDWDSSSDIFEKPNPSKQVKSRSDETEEKKEKKDSPKRRFSLVSEETVNRSEISEAEEKKEKKRQSVGNKETDEESGVKNKTAEDGGTNGLEIEEDNEKNTEEEEMLMETNEHEEKETNENPPTVSTGKQSVDQDILSKDDEDQSSKIKDSISKPNIQVSDNESNAAVDNLFQNISAEEWNKEKKADSPLKESRMKRKSSLKDSDSSTTVENLFQNISAEEWNEKKKNDSPMKESRTKRKSSLKSGESQESKNASDSGDTLVLKETDSAKKKKKKKSGTKMIVKDAESEDSEVEETAERRKSPEKSAKSNTSLKENETDDEIGSEDNDKSTVPAPQKEIMEIDENLSDAETIPTNTDNVAPLKDINSDEEDIEEEEKRPASSKNTPKNKKTKSPVKLAKKSKKSSDVYEFEDSFEVEKADEESQDNTDEDEESTPINPKAKSQQKRGNGSAIKTPKIKLNRNYSTVAVADSDSLEENVTDPDEPTSDNNCAMPSFLFNVESSGDEQDEEDQSGTEKDETHNTIDSDIARELNLAGDDDLKYSDDDIPGDECRASESEYSDEDDDGSDIDDFVVADDDVESSEYSEEEEAEELSRSLKFKRIRRKSSSEEEEEEEKEDEEVKKNDEEEMEESHDEEIIDTDVKRKTKSPNKFSELQKQKLNFSLESDKAPSAKKTKEGKIARDFRESVLLASPSVEDLQKGDKTEKKFTKRMGLIVDTTIDLCTPDSNETIHKAKSVDRSPDLKSIANSKSAKKLKKNLEADLQASTPDVTHAMQDDEEDEPVFTLQTKTPSKEEKTPKSAKKNQRDSMKRNSMGNSQPSTHNETDITQEDEDDEPVFTPEPKTPNKEKKTPKSEKKNRRDSMKRNSLENSDASRLNETDITQEDEEDEPVFASGTKTPSNEKKTPKSEKKSRRDSTKRKSLETLGASNHEEITVTQEDEEEEPTLISKTPNKEKKTPKSARKNQRDSIQLIEEAASLKTQISDLNKSMLTPNSESPVTKFLRKERLNESLPLIELKKRMSKTFDKKALSNMDEDEHEENNSSETDERKEVGEDESENEESDADDDVEEKEESQVNGNGHRDDEEDEDETDEEPEEENENGDVDDEIENEPEEESEESSEEEISPKKKGKKNSQNEISRVEKSRKSNERKSLNAELEAENGAEITPSKKKSSKRHSIGTPSLALNEKSSDSNDESINKNKKRNLSNTGVELTQKKKRARLESSATPQDLIKTKKTKVDTIEMAISQDDSDSDEAPESLGFGKARTEALEEMEKVASSLKATKEAKKKKRRDQLERIRQEKEAKVAKKSTLQVTNRPDQPVKNSLKRLPEDLLENLSDVSERPKKKRKLLKKKEDQIVPSKYMFSPGKPTKDSLAIEDNDCVAPANAGGTTNFSVINLEKVKKQPKKAAAVASFRERMLARNPRQPVSAFLMYQAKQKASGKQLASRKKA